MDASVWEFVISCFIDMGILPYVDDWYACECNAPVLITVDIERDRDGDRKDLGAGLMSFKDYYSKYGVANYKPYMDQTMDDMKYMVDGFSARSIDMTKCPLYFPQTLVAAQQAAMANPDTIPDPPLAEAA